MRKSNYDKMPATVVDGTLWKGWESIRKRLAGLGVLPLQIRL